MTKYIGLLFVAGVYLIGCAGDNMELSEEEIGLRNVPLKSENVDIKQYSYSTTPAGESKVFDRAYENAPPMIPHDVEGLIDITKDYNACIDCHSQENAPLMNATPVPDSHMYDTFKGKKVDTIVSNRYNCNLCHTPQANAKPLVGNNFKPEFRDENSKNRSNLLDVINEGVK